MSKANYSELVIILHRDQNAVSTSYIKPRECGRLSDEALGNPLTLMRSRDQTFTAIECVHRLLVSHSMWRLANRTWHDLKPVKAKFLTTANKVS